MYEGLLGDEADTSVNIPNFFSTVTYDISSDRVGRAMYLRVCIIDGAYDAAFCQEVLEVVMRTRLSTLRTMTCQDSPTIYASMLLAADMGFRAFDPRMPPTAPPPYPSIIDALHDVADADDVRRLQDTVRTGTFPVSARFRDDFRHVVIDIPMMSNACRASSMMMSLTYCFDDGSKFLPDRVALSLGTHETYPRPACDAKCLAVRSSVFSTRVRDTMWLMWKNGERHIVVVPPSGTPGTSERDVDVYVVLHFVGMRAAEQCPVRLDCVEFGEEGKEAPAELLRDFSPLVTGATAARARFPSHNWPARLRFRFTIDDSEAFESVAIAHVHVVHYR